MNGREKLRVFCQSNESRLTVKYMNKSAQSALRDSNDKEFASVVAQLQAINAKLVAIGDASLLPVEKHSYQDALKSIANAKDSLAYLIAAPSSV